jgi:DNA-binding protein YbaB
MLEDMIMIAMNDAGKKADADKEKRLGKYSQGLTGLM